MKQIAVCGFVREEATSRIDMNRVQLCLPTIDTSIQDKAI